jgi:VWFA-related protein
MLFRNSLYFLMLVLIVLPAGVCQQPPTPVLRSTTRLVQVHVTVQDRAGTPVTNLVKEEFTLFENGVRQKIAFFSRHSELKTAASPLPDLSPAAVSNRTGAVFGATVLLLDSLNTPPGFRARAFFRIQAFLRALAPREKVAIYVLAKSLTTIVDFTSDAATIVKVLEMYKHDSPDVRVDVLAAEERQRETIRAHAAYGMRDSLAAAEGAAGKRLMDKEQAIVGVDHLRATCATLRIIAARLRGIPGHKNLIWLTTGFPLYVNGRDFDPDYNRALEELSNAGVSVHPVDARGIQAPGTTTLVSTASVTLRRAADRTGGSLFEGDEIEQATRTIFAREEGSYLLAYYPSN